MHIFKVWMNAATPDEQKLLARRAGTSRAYLYHLSNEHRQAAPMLAAQIERETKVMHRMSRGRLPLIYRTDLAQACAQCEFAAKCLGPMAVRADFDIVTPEQMRDQDAADGDN